jgi:hypothetical protein
MQFLTRVKINYHHYFQRLLSEIDGLRVLVFSDSDYRKMTVPTWNQRRAETLRTPTNLMSRMLLLNSHAVSDGKRILEGNYRIFSKCFSTRGVPPNWHMDYLSGHQNTIRPYTRIGIHENTGTDIIALWELSRFLFVPSLITAYRITGDCEYSKHFFILLDDWEKNNPYLHGSNWMCGLDIAIRAFNIALGLIYLDDTDVDRIQRSRKLLWAHLVYLQQRDLYAPRKTINNHILVAAVLHYALLHLFEGETAEAWRQGAKAIVSRELDLQFHQDGGNYESATLYHQFVLESLYAAFGLLADEDLQPDIGELSIFPDNFVDVLRKATVFSAAYTSAWGATPQIGDSSDGRILVHRDYFSWSPENYSYLAEWSSLVFAGNDPCSKPVGRPESRIYQQSGMATIVTGCYGALFFAMPVIPRAAGHNHLDKGSFILRVGETPVLVDAGTFCYTPDTVARYNHRRGRAHNILMINGEDQALLDSTRIFSTPNLGEVGILLDYCTPQETSIRLWHYGYKRLAGVGSVERRIQAYAARLLLHEALLNFEWVKRHEG